MGADPKGTLEAPKGTVPFGKGLVRTLLHKHTAKLLQKCKPSSQGSFRNSPVQNWRSAWSVLRTHDKKQKMTMR